jgi:hypothetical protein
MVYLSIDKCIALQDKYIISRITSTEKRHQSDRPCHTFGKIEVRGIIICPNNRSGHQHTDKQCKNFDVLIHTTQILGLVISGVFQS